MEKPQVIRLLHSVVFLLRRQSVFSRLRRHSREAWARSCTVPSHATLAGGTGRKGSAGLRGQPRAALAVAGSRTGLLALKGTATRVSVRAFGTRVCYFSRNQSGFFELSYVGCQHRQVNRKGKLLPFRWCFAGFSWRSRAGRRTAWGLQRVHNCSVRPAVQGPKTETPQRKLTGLQLTGTTYSFLATLPFCSTALCTREMRSSF